MMRLADGRPYHLSMDQVCLSGDNVQDEGCAVRLPYLENALVEERKIREYLLSEERSEGKAAFFAAFGFSLVRWELLRDALLAHAAMNDVAFTASNPHGAKYIIEGMLQTPDGRNPPLRSVWIVESDAVVPRLVTAYPL